MKYRVNFRRDKKVDLYTFFEFVVRGRRKISFGDRVVLYFYTALYVTIRRINDFCFNVNLKVQRESSVNVLRNGILYILTI